VPIGSASSFTVGEMSYAGNWNGSASCPPARSSRDSSTVSAPSIRARAATPPANQVFAALRLRPTESSELRALAYAASYRLQSVSDFTLLLDDPVNGDEKFEQIDRRVIYGGRVSYRVVHHLGAVVFDTTIGGETRNDDIHVELWHTAPAPATHGHPQRRRPRKFRGSLHPTRKSPPASGCDLTSAVELTCWSFAVDSHLDNGGVGAAHSVESQDQPGGDPIESPKATLDFYLNYGHGFHSNDVRGVFRAMSGHAAYPRRGREIGTRARLWGAGIWRLPSGNSISTTKPCGTGTMAPPR